jgi:hypothetical protein
MFKAEVYIELDNNNLCAGCFFFSSGSNTNVCELTGDEWESETCDRPEWCQLKEVKVMR